MYLINIYHLKVSRKIVMRSHYSAVIKVMNYGARETDQSAV